MNIAGTGITTFQARLQQDFRVQTTWAIKWSQMSNGSWVYTDRGATCDIYETEVRLQGIRGRVEEFVTQLNLNRTGLSNSVTLSAFESNEKIFGADISYTSVTATLLGTPSIRQNEWKSFECTARFRAISPTMTGTATFPDLKCLDIGYDANVDRYTINKMDNYAGTYTYLDQESDIGVFMGRFQFTTTEMQNLRTWYRTNRGTTANITTIYGVTNPFGPLRGG
jgi:hypothetical protein